MSAVMNEMAPVEAEPAAVEAGPAVVETLPVAVEARPAVVDAFVQTVTVTPVVLKPEVRDVGTSVEHLEVVEEPVPVEEAPILAVQRGSAFQYRMRTAIKKTKEVAVVVGRQTKKTWKKAELAMMKGVRFAAQKTHKTFDKAIEKRQRKAVTIGDENNDLPDNLPASL